MFCSKCGKELKETDGFCPRCGSKVGGKPQPEPQTKPAARIGGLQGHAGVYLTALVCLIISLVFLGHDMYELTIDKMEEFEEGFTMFEDTEVWQPLLTVGYLAAMAAMLWPVIVGQPFSKGHFALGTWVPVVSVGRFAYVLLTVKGKIADEDGMEEIMEAFGIELGLTDEAWVFLAISVLTVILCVRAGRDILYAQEFRNKESIIKPAAPVTQTQTVTPSSYAQGKIPAWKRVEMEKAAAEKKEQ